MRGDFARVHAAVDVDDDLRVLRERSWQRRRPVALTSARRRDTSLY